MKVGELIEILEDMDLEAEVLIASQPNWPFEYSVAGIVTREDILAEEEGEGEPVYTDGTAPMDVFIVEGQQLRYGSKLAWSLAR